MKSDESNNFARYVSGVLTGAAIMIGINWIHEPNIDKAVIYNRQGKPAIMRLYRTGTDKILVQNREKPNEFGPRDDYLSNFKGYDRDIEELEIKKAAGW